MKFDSSAHKTPSDFRQRLALLAAGFVAGMISLGVWIAVQSHNSPVSVGSNPTPAQQKPASASGSALIDAINTMPGVSTASAPVADPAVDRIAARFQCACPDQCGQPVARCQCPTATAERAFLYQQLQKGRSEAEAEQALNKQYGGLEL